MGLDLLDHMGHSISLPDLVERWLHRVAEDPIVETETLRVRGAIAQWLSQGMDRPN